MSPQRSLPRLRRRNPILLGVVLLLLFATACGIGIGLSKAQSPPQEGAALPPSQERKLEKRFHPRLPIKVKVKNLQNEKWARDIEVEVTNTSTKPIYFLCLFFALPEVLSPDGNEVGFPLRYGRMDFIDFKEPVTPQDVPIRPGEKIVLKIPQSDLDGWESFASKRNLPKSEPKRVQLFFCQINFGDGTGFVGTAGTPIPNKEVSTTSSCVKDRDGGGVNKTIAGVPIGRPPDLLLRSLFPQLPAAFLPVSFYPASGAELVSNMVSPQSNCPGTPCFWEKRVKYTCQCGEANKTESAPLTDPSGVCSLTKQINRTCKAADGTTLTCPEFFINEVPCSKDEDGDGWTVVEGDCDDRPNSLQAFNTNPGAEEVCNDGIDNNCDGNTDSGDPTCQQGGGGEEEEEEVAYSRRAAPARRSVAHSMT